MGNWTHIIINAAVTTLLLAGGILLASGAIQMHTQSLERVLTHRTDLMEQRLERIEKALAGMQTAPAAPQQGGGEGGKTSGNTDEKLNAILDKLSSMESSLRMNLLASMKKQPSAGFPPMPALDPGKPAPGRAPRWIDSLPEEKREAVREAFREHTRTTRELLSAERQEGTFDIERLREIQQEREAALNEALREILTDEEYEGYLKERPGRFPGPLPQGPGAEAGR